jgi:serine O-acetyltransferase
MQQNEQSTSSGLLSMLRADTFRQCGHWSTGSLCRVFLVQRCFRPILTLRLCQWVAHSGGSRKILLPFFKLLHGLATQMAGMDLSWKTEIGPGLCIIHGWGLVVAPGVRIGSNVTLFHGVTLGRRDRIHRTGDRSDPGYPIIEDEVWIGPHAIIVGDVTIGRGCRIAGGAFVTASVPAHTIVGGNPAVVLKTNCPPDVFNRSPVL